VTIFIGSEAYVIHHRLNWVYCTINAIHSAGGRSPLLDQLLGTRFQMPSEARLKTLSGNHWKRCFLD